MTLLGLLTSDHLSLNQSLPDNPFTLIDVYSKDALMCIFSDICIKSTYFIYERNPLLFQQNQLLILKELSSNQYSFYQEKIHQYIIDEQEKLVRGEQGFPSWTVFTRYGLLYILEQLKNKNIQTGNKDIDAEACINILEFILITNKKLSALIETSSKNIHESENSIIETVPNFLLNFNELLYIDSNISSSRFRAIFLIKKLLANGTYKEQFQNFLLRDYKSTANDIEDFLFKIESLFNSISDRQLDSLVSVISLIEFENFTGLLNGLSKSLSIDNPNEQLKIITIRKYPLSWINEDMLVIHDIFLLFDKFNFQIFHDFWRDSIKPNLPNTLTEEQIKKELSRYYGQLGLNFEYYVSYILKKPFSAFPNFIFKSLNELKDKGHEYADVYIRKDDKIIIAQIKSNIISDDVKYSQEFVKLNDAFFDKFGGNQIFESIKNFSLSKFSVFDECLDMTNTYTIYPVIGCTNLDYS